MAMRKFRRLAVVLGALLAACQAELLPASAGGDSGGVLDVGATDVGSDASGDTSGATDASDDASADAVEDAVGEDTADTGADSDATTDSDADAGADGEDTADTGADSEDTADAGADGDATADSEDTADTGADSDATADSDADTGADSDADTGADSEDTADTGADSEDTADTGADSEDTADTGADTGADSEDTADTGADTGADSEDTAAGDAAGDASEDADALEDAQDAGSDAGDDASADDAATDASADDAATDAVDTLPDPCATKVCDDNNVCTTDGCAAGACTHEPTGGVCDDGDACSDNDSCQGGACKGVAKVCSAGATCTTASCVQGACVTAKAADGAPCDDGNGCTVADACKAGTCSGGGPKSCDDGNVCTKDVCSDGACKTFGNQGAPCDDGDVCTLGDACLGATCVAGGPNGCDDKDPCTADSCAKGACVNAKQGTAPCDDGQPCTAVDSCVDGVCIGGAPALWSLLHPLPNEQQANGVAVTSDGAAWVVGWTMSAGSVETRDALALRFDAQGTFLAQAIVDADGANGQGDDVLTAAVAAADGGVVATGYASRPGLDACTDLWIIGLDKNGTKVKEGFVGGSSHCDAGQALVATKDGYVAVGSNSSKTGSPQSWAVWFNQALSPTGKQAAHGSSSAHERYFAVLYEASVDRVVAAGASGLASTGGSTPIARAYGQDGALVWTANLPDTPGNDYVVAIAAQSGKLMLAIPVTSSAGDPNISLVQLDLSGKVLGSSTFGGSGQDAITGLAAAPGGVTMASVIRALEPGKSARGGWFALGGAAQPLAHRMFEPDAPSALRGVAVGSGSRVWLVGDRASSKGDLDAWVIRLDQHGNVSCADNAGCDAKSCDDGKPCTFDGCLKGGCVHSAALDGTPCGTDKVCAAGTCTP